MKNKIKRSEYKGEVARVPYTFVHSMGRIWAAQKYKIKDYSLTWSVGRRHFELYEPYSLSPIDMQNYMALLHVLQHPGDFNVEVFQDIRLGEKYKMTIKMKYLYELLKLPGAGSSRSDLKKSIVNHVKTVFRVRQPGEDIIFFGLGLHAGTVKFYGAGRNGLTAEFYPDRGLIDDSGLTQNVTRLIKYKTGMAKLIDFLVMGKLDAGVDLTYKGWMEVLTRGSRMDNFKRDFEPALEEISARDFLVELREDGLKIKYCGSKQKALSSQ